jgi:hypothetical protein
MQTLVLDSGKAELLNPDIVASPKYFKVSSKPILNPSSSTDGNDEEIFTYWLQKDISIYKVIDKDTIEFTCIIEENECVDEVSSICLFFDETSTNIIKPDTPFLLGVLPTVIPAGNRLVISIQFKLTNASTQINFQFITSNELEEGMMSLNTLITLGNQITKNTTLLEKIYLPDVLDTPEITSETFSIS